MTAARWRRAATTALAAVLFGAAMTAALAPAEAWWFAPCCLAGLFYLLYGARAARRFGAGFAFGAGWFGAGMWWVVPGLLETSDAGLPLALGLGALLVSYSALFSGAAALAAGAARGRPAWLAIAATAAAWTLGEWLRGHLLLGMPMLPAGLAHASGPLAGYGPLTGIHGIGFAGALCAAALAHCLATPHGGWPALRRAVPPACLAGTVLAGGAALRALDWTVPDGRALEVRLVHTDVTQQGKFDLRAELRTQHQYMRLAAASPATLTVLPETAVSTDWDRMPPALAQAWRAAAGDQVLLLGAFAGAPTRAGLLGDGTNSMFAVGAGVDYRYDKVHLVPVGELLPAWLAWLAAQMSVQYGALLPGAPAQPPLVVQGIRVGVSICYENQFEDYLAGQARTADMLLVASNFAWGRGSHAALGHLQASRLRAIETGRWVMQVSNGGATALVDPQGRIQAMLEPGSAGLLDVRVPAMTGSTPFVRHGNAPLLALAMTLLAGAAWHALRRGAGVRPRVAWRGD